MPATMNTYHSRLAKSVKKIALFVVVVVGGSYEDSTSLKKWLCVYGGGKELCETTTFDARRCDPLLGTRRVNY